MALRGKSGNEVLQENDGFQAESMERNCSNGIQEYEKSCTGRGVTA